MDPNPHPSQPAPGSSHPMRDVVLASAVSPGQPRREPPPPPPPQQIVIRTGGVVGKFFTGLAWSGLMLCILIIIGQYAAYQEYFQTDGGVKEKYHSLSKTGTDKVAILNISGLMMSGEGYFKKQVDKIEADDHVKAVVVRVDSPGGAVTAADYMLHHLKKLKAKKKIPLVVSMGGMATSGGYYVSMAVGDEEKSIYAEPTTTTGSIGVILPYYDISGLLARFDIKDDSISSHPRKQMLSMTKEMTPEDREIIQKYINDAFERFKSVVKEGRPVYEKDEEALDKLATGEIFSADQALKLGLVDQLGFIEEAIDRAIELAGLDKDNVRVVHYDKTLSLAEQLVGGQQASAHPLDPAALLEMTTPRAYYLTTWLPAIVSSYAR